VVYDLAVKLFHLSQKWSFHAQL